MRGGWQKEIPSASGQYWTATRQHEIAGLKTVVYNDRGVLVYAGMPVTGPHDGWAGWWWSLPVEEPPKPPEW